MLNEKAKGHLAIQKSLDSNLKHVTPLTWPSPGILVRICLILHEDVGLCMLELVPHWLFLFMINGRTERQSMEGMKYLLWEDISQKLRFHGNTGVYCINTVFVINLIQNPLWQKLPKNLQSLNCIIFRLMLLALQHLHSIWNRCHPSKC